MDIGRLLAMIIAVSWAASTAPACAADPAPLVFQYQIQHPIFGDIGTYTNSIVKAGASTTVHTAVRVLVKVLGMVMYREVTDRTEEWRGDRLASFRSVTQKNGHIYDVSGEAEGDTFVVTGPDGTFRAPADVQPPNPWSARCLKSDAMLSSVTGRIFPARIVDRGQDALSVAGQTYRAHEYEIDADRSHLVWFDQDGVPLQIESTEEGQPVRLVLMRHPDEAQTIAAVPSH